MKPGEIVLVKFPFASLAETKKRPGLVLNQVTLHGRDRLVVIAMITSAEGALQIQGDIHLKEWKESGLLHPSIARLAKVATLDDGLIVKTLGALQAGDLKRVTRGFRALFSSWL